MINVCWDCNDSVCWLICRYKDDSLWASSDSSWGRRTNVLMRSENCISSNQRSFFIATIITSTQQETSYMKVSLICTEAYEASFDFDVCENPKRFKIILSKKSSPTFVISVAAASIVSLESYRHPFYYKLFLHVRMKILKVQELIKGDIVHLQNI